MHHERATPLPTVTDDDMARIENMSMSGLSQFQICPPLRSESSQILWHKFNNKWTEFQGKQYLKTSDPFESSKLHVMHSREQLNSLIP